MFNRQHIAHVRAFGFMVLAGMLSRGGVTVLRAQVRAPLAEAFGGIGTNDDSDGPGGIRGDHLRLWVDRAPVVETLIADDPGLFQGFSELLGLPAVAIAPLATLGVLFDGDVR